LESREWPDRTCPYQFAALLDPHPIAAGEDPGRTPSVRVVCWPANDRGVAVGGKRDGTALLSKPHRAGADQFAALLGPHPIAAGEDPGRTPSVRVVCWPANDRGVAVCGKRDGMALLSKPHRAGADQFAALLGPHPVAAREDPRRTATVVARPTDDGGVAVRRNGDRLTLINCRANRTGADQFAALLGPHPIAAREDPRRPGERLIVRPADDHGVTLRRNGDRLTLKDGSKACTAADQLWALLGELGRRRVRGAGQRADGRGTRDDSRDNRGRALPPRARSKSHGAGARQNHHLHEAPQDALVSPMARCCNTRYLS
jgi:hypothetical protein